MRRDNISIIFHFVAAVFGDVWDDLNSTGHTAISSDSTSAVEFAIFRTSDKSYSYVFLAISNFRIPARRERVIFWSADSFPAFSIIGRVFPRVLHFHLTCPGVAVHPLNGNEEEDGEDVSVQKAGHIAAITVVYTAMVQRMASTCGREREALPLPIHTSPPST